MKKIISNLPTVAAILLSASFLAACEGDDGAKGDTGAAGADGTNGLDGNDGIDATGPQPEDFPPLNLSSDPTGVGGCQPATGVWYPPNGPGAGTFSGWLGHPCPQPRPAQNGSANSNTFFGSTQVTTPATGNGDTFATASITTVTTPPGQHAAISSEDEPPGSNFLNTVDSNLYTFLGDEMPNTQPSRLGDSSYLLHSGDVRSVNIDKSSPEDDLRKVIDALAAAEGTGAVPMDMVAMGLDILEGNDMPGKAYSGFPALHYNGPNKHKMVEPIYDDQGVKIGGNVDVNMIYFGQHIESDVALVDPSLVQDVPWTVTYHVNILSGGIEDFSPMTMAFDVAPDGSRGPFHASMDQSYFPMLEEGKRYVVKIKNTFGKHFNLTYTWGWRIHPPRVQVMENALKTAGGLTLLEHEEVVFGINPMGGEAQKQAAIAMIGDLSPAKRMWNMLQAYNTSASSELGGNGADATEIPGTADAMMEAFLDWQDRTKLPTGVDADPNATLTLLYVNNTLYGSKQGTTGDGSGLGAGKFKGVCNGCAHDWDIRPYNYKVTLLNGDHFPHGYMNVDFGGSRGWENQFQDTDPTTALAAHDHTELTTIIGNGDPIGGNASGDLVDHVLLDNTPNLGKQALRDVPPTVNYAQAGIGQGVEVIKGDVVETGILEVITNDRVFPMNTGGMEEFLLQTPRETTLDGTVNDNAALQLGSGCFFTFGRHHAWPNAGGPWGAIIVPPVATAIGDSGMLGVESLNAPSIHKVDITYNFEPSRRLKIYQFDPLHHDVAVYSLH